jgi:dinuclear metal center YbgI/SA1388 family protein
MLTTDLAAWLDDYLLVNEYEDYSGAWNGLQVEGRAHISRVAFAVDACLASIEEAITREADMLIVHHGLLWGPNAPITGSYYQKLSSLIRANLPLYSCHLPLDAHPEVGNNHVLARQLGLNVSGLFGEYKNQRIGVYCDTELSIDLFSDMIEKTIPCTPYVIQTGPKLIRRIGIITGGAGRMVMDALSAGCDTFLTGEGSHDTYFLAEENGINLIYAGHYATETVGVKALADRLKSQFRLDCFFIDHPTGL